MLDDDVKKVLDEEQKKDKEIRKNIFVESFILLGLLGGAIVTMLNIGGGNAGDQFLGIFTVASVIVRSIVTYRIIKVSERFNRNSTFWSLFAFSAPFVTTLALGILGRNK